jgi:hypothetical protein
MVIESDEEHKEVTKAIGGVHLLREPSDGCEPLNIDPIHVREKKDKPIPTGKAAKKKDQQIAKEISVPEEDPKAGLNIDPKWLPEIEKFTIRVGGPIDWDKVGYGPNGNGPFRNISRIVNNQVRRRFR